MVGKLRILTEECYKLFLRGNTNGGLLIQHTCIRKSLNRLIYLKPAYNDTQCSFSCYSTLLVFMCLKNFILRLRLHKTSVICNYLYLNYHSQLTSILNLKIRYHYVIWQMFRLCHVLRKLRQYFGHLANLN